MNVLVVAGARPNFMKVAPVLAELREHGDDAVLVHTGQHYDERMSAAFFADLDLPEPDFHLGVGSGSHAAQTARIMEAFEPVLLDVAPGWVVVVGDVNSTLACALVTAKLRYERGCRLAHVEAGLRSGDWRMPEEVNRVLTDRLADLLLTPTRDAAENLIREGIEPSKIAFVGNVMIDTLLRQLPRARKSELPRALGVERGGYVAATLHRPSNVDDADALKEILEGFATIAERLPVVLPLHPRTRSRIEEFGLEGQLSRITGLEPLGYTDMVALLDGSALVLTDSGGLQEETTALGIPCVTLREQTERPITITEGTNRLAPWPLSAEGIRTTAEAALRDGRRSEEEGRPEGWDGRTAERIREAMLALEASVPP